MEVKHLLVYSVLGIFDHTQQWLNVPRWEYIDGCFPTLTLTHLRAKHFKKIDVDAISISLTDSCFHAQF